MRSFVSQLYNKNWRDKLLTADARIDAVEWLATNKNYRREDGNFELSLKRLHTLCVDLLSANSRKSADTFGELIDEISEYKSSYIEEYATRIAADRMTDQLYKVISDSLSIEMDKGVAA